MKVRCRDLGPMDYAACWELQRTLFEELLAEKNRRRNGCGAKESGPAADKTDTRPDDVGTVLLVEHPPVYTLGKSGHAENLLVDRTALEQLGAQFFHIDRGGDITFHGPGQLVCYPILDLERLGIGLREYIGRLEETVIRVVAHYGIAAGRIDGASGVWLGGAAEQRSAETERNAEETDGRNAADQRKKRQGGTERRKKYRRNGPNKKGCAPQNLRNRRPLIALCNHARVRAERRHRFGVVFADQPVRIQRSRRDLDGPRNKARSRHGRSQTAGSRRIGRTAGR